MTWKSFHRRGEILRTVIATADASRDGVLPMDVEGVAETFGDELRLLGALQLRWHTRLAGRIERELMHQPMDLEGAVVDRLAAPPPRSSPASARSSTTTAPSPVDDAMARGAGRRGRQGAHPARRDGRPGQRRRRQPRPGSASAIESCRARATLPPDPDDRRAAGARPRSTASSRPSPASTPRVAAPARSRARPGLVPPVRDGSDGR